LLARILHKQVLAEVQKQTETNKSPFLKAFVQEFAGEPSETMIWNVLWLKTRCFESGLNLLLQMMAEQLVDNSDPAAVESSPSEEEL
jgi:hypothetical protein